MKKVFTVVLALVILATLSFNVSAESLPIGYFNIAEPYRYLTFATDGGSFIKVLERPIGDVIDLDAFIPTKDGFVFAGWFSDPRTKVNQVHTITLDENVVVYAKWLDDGTPKVKELQKVSLSTEEALAYGDYVDEKTGVPVTRLWKEQNERLKLLMAEHNKIFNR